MTRSTGTITGVVSLAVCLTAFVFAQSSARSKRDLPQDRTFTNSIGMRFVRIAPGEFEMGSDATPLPGNLTGGKRHLRDGDFDERPVHRVTITRPSYMGAHEVTNAQYEEFDPAHRQLRSKAGFSQEDDEAVIFVSWHDAVRFCDWLSKKEGRPYRLPTEAEWEYAVRTGTRTPFHSGTTLPPGVEKMARQTSVAGVERYDNVSLRVGQFAPNAWGLHDVHGNVEEWVHDWYGPYVAAAQADPVGRADGDFRVTRGGSHTTQAYYLRSSNRSGTLPEDKNWLIGFRVVLGEMPKSRPLPRLPAAPFAQNVRQDIPRDIARGPDPEKPYFKGPRVYVKISPGSYGPLFDRHNHFAAVTACPNGDLLAAWFSCVEEMGRELSVAVSRLRYGADEWDSASVFWDAPDRNDHAHAFWTAEDGTIFHFNGLGANLRSLAVVMRTSRDNGATWSRARLIYPEHHDRRNTVVESVFRLREGKILLPADGRNGSVISLSSDEGRSWEDPGGTIRGTHAAVAQLWDGRLLAFGRGAAIDGRMPMSISADMGKTWAYSPSEFQPIGGGQRLVLLRLREGPLFFASFCRDMDITDSSGRSRKVAGLFSAVSLDQGHTWPYKRLISNDGPKREIEGMDGHWIPFDAHRSEHSGYLSVTQAADGVVHLISSRQHYAFNLKWLMTPAPPPEAAPYAPAARRLPAARHLPKTFSGGLAMQQPAWKFDGVRAKPELVAALANGRINVRTSPDQEARWRNVGTPDREIFSVKQGFTAEVRVRVLKSAPDNRGFDIELYDGAACRYAVSITERGVYWYQGPTYGTAFLAFQDYAPLVEGIDNSGRFHTYRLAVRPDRVVQIYRDGKLLAVRPGEYRNPRDAYMTWGAGGGGEAVLDYVAYDPTGASQPGDPGARNENAQ